MKANILSMKMLAIRAAVVTAMFVFAAPSLWAYEFDEDGIYYNIVSNEDFTCEVTYKSSSNNSYSGSVTIPTTVSYGRGTYTVVSIGDNAFSGCSDLTTVTLPTTVTSIKSSAFYNCGNLTSVTNTVSLKSIGEYAFFGCSNLASIEISDSVKTIDEGAFFYCSSLKSVALGSSVTKVGGTAFEECTGLTSVTFGESVAIIGVDAFFGCTSLLSVDIPSSVDSIGNGAFSGCNSMTSIQVDSENKSYSSVDGVLYSKDVSELILCPGGKTSATVPISVKVIDSNAFNSCGSLTWVKIGYYVASIGDYAFSGCTSLTQITSFNPTPPACGEEVFYDVDKDACVLYVPIGYTEAYANANTWKDFMNMEETEETRIASATVAEDGEAVEVSRYTIDGKRISAAQKGINIVRYSDGTVRKEMVK